MAGLLDQVAPASPAPPPAFAGAGLSLLAGVKPPASAGAGSRDVSLGERFAANFAEGHANTLAGAMGLYQRAGAAARDRATELLAAIDAARAAGSAEGVPPPALDAGNLGFGPALVEDPVGTALARNEGKPIGEMVAERTEQLARADALKRQAAAEELQRQRDFAAMPPATGVLGKVAATAGYLAGGAATPESALPVGRTGTLLGTLVKGAMVNAATTAATDPIVQRAQIDVGTRKTYDPSQTLLSALIGGAAGGSLNVAPEIIVGLARRVGSLLRKAPAAVTVGDVRATVPQMDDLDPTLRGALEAKGVLAKPAPAAGVLDTVVPVKPLPPRPAWPEGMPPVAVSQPAKSTVWVKEHPDYDAAKAGDPAAAMRLVADTANEGLLDQIRATIGDRRPIIVPVHAVEATGRNQIGNAYGSWLSHRLGLPFEGDIVQVNRAYHTGARGPERIVRRVEFDGPVEPGRDYFLADDFLGMGSTLADLRAYIEAKGGRVIGASTLMASRGSGPLAATSAQLAALRAKYPDLEPWWREHFGHGFEGLTNAEAGYVHRSFKSADQVRDRIVATEQAGVAGLDAGAVGEDKFGDDPTSRPGPAGGEGSAPGGGPARRGR